MLNHYNKIKVNCTYFVFKILFHNNGINLFKDLIKIVLIVFAQSPNFQVIYIEFLLSKYTLQYIKLMQMEYPNDPLFIILYYTFTLIPYKYLSFSIYHQTHYKYQNI